MHVYTVTSLCIRSGFTRVFQRALSSFSQENNVHAVPRRSGTLGTRENSARIMSLAASKPTDVDLVEVSVEKIIAGRALCNLVDIGINLADSSYDKVSILKSPDLAIATLQLHETDTCRISFHRCDDCKSS